MAHIMQAGLVREVNLPQSTCGFTMTIQRVYADANRVVVGYTITGPTNRSFINAFYVEPTLVDTQGLVMRRIEGDGSALLNNQQGAVAVFDASAVAGTGSALALQLTVPYIRAFEQAGDTQAAAQCETYMPDLSINGHPTRIVTVPTPLTFNLTVPITSERRQVSMSPVANMTGTAAVPVSIVVTPSEARVNLTGVPLSQASIDLVVNGQSFAHTPGDMVGCWTVDSTAGVACSFDVPTYGTQGTWQVLSQR